MPQAPAVTIEFEVTDDTPPKEERRGAPSVWDDFVKAALGAEGKWVASAKKNAKGERKPNVGSQSYYNLRKRFGGPDPKRPEGSDYFKKHGHYLDLRFTDAVSVPSSTGKSKLSKGVVWARRVEPKSEEAA